MELYTLFNIAVRTHVHAVVKVFINLNCNASKFAFVMFITFLHRDTVAIILSSFFAIIRDTQNVATVSQIPGVCMHICDCVCVCERVCVCVCVCAHIYVNLLIVLLATKAVRPHA